MTQNGLFIARFRVFFFICIISDTYSTMNIITVYVNSMNSKNKTLLCISYSTCPTVNVNKHLSCLTYGRVPTKGSNELVYSADTGQKYPESWILIYL